MDDPESPTLRISYARALNNPKVKDGRGNATEEPSTRAMDQRRGSQPDAYGAHRPHADPRGGGRDMRGPPEQVCGACAYCWSAAKDRFSHCSEARHIEQELSTPLQFSRRHL